MPSQSQLKSELAGATNDEGSGLNMNMWGTIVDRDGIVCAVAFTGKNRGAQWPGSRVISAQKANTANAFSLDPSAVSGGNGVALALSTANLFSAVQPGGRDGIWAPDFAMSSLTLKNHGMDPTNTPHRIISAARMPWRIDARRAGPSNWAGAGGI